MTTDKEQIGPRVRESLADAYKWLVRQRNDGVYRGRLAQEMEEAMKLQMGMFALAHPEKITELNKNQPQMAEEFADGKDVWQNAVAQTSNKSKPPTSQDIQDLAEEVRRLSDLSYATARDVREIREEIGDSESTDEIGNFSHR